MKQTNEYTFTELYDRLPIDLRNKVAETEQNPTWHPEGNVDEHIRLVFEYAKSQFDDINLMVSAIFHDLGKTDTTYLKEKRDKSGFFWTSPNHENHAKLYIKEFIELYDDLDINVEMVYEVCANHMKAHLYEDGSLKKKAKRKAFEEQTYFEDTMRFTQCDTMGR